MNLCFTLQVKGYNCCIILQAIDDFTLVFPIILQHDLSDNQ